MKNIAVTVFSETFARQKKKKIARKKSSEKRYHKRTKVAEMREVQFTVEGSPLSKGRPKFSTVGGYARTYTPKKTIESERYIASKFWSSAPKDGLNYKAFQGEVSIVLAIEYPIPKGTSKVLRQQMAGNIFKPCKKPDLDNVIKVYLDALNGVAFYDDKQVISITASKVYSEEPKTTVRIIYKG